MLLDSCKYESIPDVPFIQALESFFATLVTTMSTKEPIVIPDWNLLDPTLHSMFGDEI